MGHSTRSQYRGPRSRPISLLRMSARRLRRRAGRVVPPVRAASEKPGRTLLVLSHHSNRGARSWRLPSGGAALTLSATLMPFRVFLPDAVTLGSGRGSWLSRAPPFWGLPCPRGGNMSPSDQAPRGAVVACAFCSTLNRVDLTKVSLGHARTAIDPFSSIGRSWRPRPASTAG